MDIMMLSLHSDPLAELGSRDNGGMSVFLLETARNLVNLGHRIDIFTLAEHDKKSEPKVVNLQADKMRLIRLPSPYPSRVRKDRLVECVPELMSSFSDFMKQSERRYDLIHSHYWISGVLGSTITRKYHIPHCLTFHTLGEVKNRSCPGESEPSRRLQGEKNLMEECDHIVAFTEAEKKDLLSLGGIVPEKITIVPCGVDIQQFRPVDGGQVRQKLGIGEDELMLLFVGRFAPIKGVEMALEALARLHQGNRSNRYKLVLVGGDSENTHIQEYITRLEIEDHIVFAGRVNRDSLAFYYSAADVLLIPSFHESFSLVALEALACGTPIIANGVGGIPQLLRPGCGVLLEDNHPTSIADAICDLMVKKRVKTTGSEDIRRSASNYSWSTTTLQLERVYTHLVDDMGEKL